MEKISINDVKKIKEMINNKINYPFIVDNISDDFIKKFNDDNLNMLLSNSDCLVKDSHLKKQSLMNFNQLFVNLKNQQKENNVNKRYTLQMGNIVSKGFFAREKTPPFSCLLPLIESHPLFELVSSKLLEANLWLDSGSNTTKLHFDPVDNFLILLEGVKEIYLLPREDSKYAYPSNYSPIHSQVDILNPNYEEFPLFKNAKIIKVVISAGQALYIPAGYWHEVVSSGWNKAINLWWGISLTRKLQSPMLQFFGKEILSRIMLKGSCVPHTVSKKEIDELKV